MQPDRLEVDELFLQALERPAKDRAAFVQRSCHSDQNARDELESLLSAHDDAEGFLSQPVLDADSLRPPESFASLVGARLDRYLIVAEVASGGMGTVYRAVRADEQYDQQVAIKVLDCATMTPALRRRFRQERQSLARLSHPSITRLLDGGSTPDGRPYLVMEYVAGRSLDAYADEQRLTIDDRLRVFCSVCDAVHFAHQNLIVHRDIKPGNILITQEGTAKLLDFGIAKLLDEGTGLAVDDPTMTLMRILTPRYASPEQIRGEPISTATDIYSLGVVLYELLTGHRPYSMDSHSPYDRERAVCEQEPTVPSAAVADINDIVSRSTNDSFKREDVGLSRRVSLNQLRRALRGDLDNIVLMALQKDPVRRYASVQEFSQDIRSHLGGLPVLARKHTLAYRVTKLLSRNKGTAVASTVLVLALIAGTIGTSVGLVRARRAEQLARAERVAAVLAEDTARSVAVFLQDTLASANPYRNGRDATVLELLEDANRRIDTELANQPGVEAEVRYAIANTYAGLWMWQAAAPQLRIALRLNRDLYGNVDPRVAQCLSLLGRAETFRQSSKSVSLQREGLAIRRELFGKEHADVAESMGNLGYALWHAARPQQWDEAEANYRGSLAMYDRLEGSDHRDKARFAFSLGVMLLLRKQYEDAEPMFLQALELYRALPKTEDRYFVECMNRYSVLLRDTGRYHEAEALLSESLEVSPRWYGTGEPQAATWILADVYHAEKDHAATEKLLSTVVIALCDRWDQKHPELAGVVSDRKHSIAKAISSDARADALVGALMFMSDAGERPDDALLNCMRHVGAWLCDTDRPPSAQRVLRRYLDLAQPTSPLQQWQIADTRRLLGACSATTPVTAVAKP